MYWTQVTLLLKLKADCTKLVAALGRHTMENLMVIGVEVIAPENPLDKNNPEQRLLYLQASRNNQVQI